MKSGVENRLNFEKENLNLDNDKSRTQNIIKRSTSINKENNRLNFEIPVNENIIEEIINSIFDKKIMLKVCKTFTDSITDKNERNGVTIKCMEEMEELKKDELWKMKALKKLINNLKYSRIKCATKAPDFNVHLKSNEEFNNCINQSFQDFLFQLFYDTALTFNPISDYSETVKSYGPRKGALTEILFIPSLEFWAKKNDYSYMKSAYFLEGKIFEKPYRRGKGGHRLEFVFYKTPEEMYGLDLTATVSQYGLKKHWEGSKYYPALKKYLVVVVSDAFKAEDFEKWNDEIQENIKYKDKVQVIHYKDINRILNPLSTKGAYFGLINGDIAKESLEAIEKSKPGLHDIKILKEELKKIFKKYGIEEYSPDLEKIRNFVEL